MNDRSASSEFGVYRLSSFNQFLIRLCQRTRVNYLGRRISGLLRRIIRKTHGRDIVDVEVCGIKWRGNIKNNASEKKFIFMPQFYDKKERDFILSRRNIEGVFLDIGANAGIYSLTAAKVYKKVISFEPNPGMYDRLRFNIKMNNKDEIIDAYEIALSDCEGFVDFEVDESNLGESKIAVSGSKSGISVKTKRLVDVLDELNITQIDGIKIDVEGHEEVILKDFFNSANRELLPNYIIVETLHKNDWGGELDEILENLSYVKVIKSKLNTVYFMREGRGCE